MSQIDSDGPGRSRETVVTPGRPPPPPSATLARPGDGPEHPRQTATPGSNTAGEDRHSTLSRPGGSLTGLGALWMSLAVCPREAPQRGRCRVDGRLKSGLHVALRVAGQENRRSEGSPVAHGHSQPLPLDRNVNGCGRVR
ncbi:hypothetical protein GCM10010405_47790 [Streptomyces macrosporus]|uniref:Uncharacterized protein n=1 Tax=Streptomyces macrosporus TaxID=44032 RepID=A0ABN3KEY1_9ACTN